MYNLQASSSPYIIRLHEILLNASYVKPDKSVTLINAVVMEYAPYGNFNDFIYFTGPFTESLAKHYFRSLILGICILFPLLLVFLKLFNLKASTICTIIWMSVIVIWSQTTCWLTTILKWKYVISLWLLVLRIPSL